MTDTELKIAIAVVGIVGGIVSALTSAILFFWMDGRKRYQNQLAGLRMLTMVVESAAANVKANALQRADLKLDWFISHADTLLRDPNTFSIVRKLIEQVAAVQRMASLQQADTSNILAALEQLKSEVNALLSSHIRSYKRRVFLAAKAG